MAERTSWQRLTVFAVVGVLVAAVPLGFLYFFANPVKGALTAGNRALALGEQAFEAENYAAAAARFEEAALQASKAIDAAQARFRRPLTEVQRQELVAQLGGSYWLRARALRDRAFATAAADGKPLQTTLDGTLGERFRSVLAIPDLKERGEALGALRESATILTQTPEVQIDALRTETMIRPPSWVAIERFAKQELALDDSSSRALSQLAQFHYEQPQIDARNVERGPTPLAKRSAARMVQARGYLDRMLKTKNVNFWRASELDAQITSWLKQYHAGKGKSEAAAEAKRLNAVLAAALERAQDPKELTAPSVFEVRSALLLHRIALAEQAGAALRAGEGVKATDELLTRSLALCTRLGNDKAALSVVEECALGAVDALLVARPVLRQVPPAAWRERMKPALELATLAAGRKSLNMNLFAQVITLLDREAILANSRGDAATAKDLTAQADRWSDDGLKAGKEAKLDPARMAELQAVVAERQVRQNVPPEKLRSLLDDLRKLPSPQARALAAFLEGVSLERQGRLEQARLKIEEAEAAGLDPSRADLVLGGLYLATNRPSQALARLNRLATAYERIEALPELERAWVAEFIRTREDLQSLQVVANLGTARRVAADHVRLNPGKPVPAESLSRYEQAARKLTDSLPARSPQRQACRIALAQYLTQTGRPADADKVLEEARKESPDSLAVLQARVAAALRRDPGDKPGPETTKKLIARADAVLDAHLKAHTNDVAARLFKASVLSRTGRAAEAVKYLEDPANFPEKEERYKRVLALALLGKGDRAAGAEVLRSLPPNPGIDAVLVQLAGPRDAQEKELTQALKRHERSALLRCMQGMLDLERNKPKEAAEAFFAALEYTQVRATAEAGLTRALFAWIPSDPAAARKRIGEMIADAPNQKALFLAYAAACLDLDDIGTPFQKWSEARTMASALNAWEALFAKEPTDPSAGALTKAEFWRVAGRDDLARAEVRRALAERPESPLALRASVALALAQGRPGAKEAAELLARLAKVSQDAPLLGILGARVDLLERKAPEARQKLEAVLRDAPTNEEAAYLLATVLLELKDNDAALAHARAWRGRNPDSVAAASFLVRVLAAGGKVDEARAALNEVVGTGVNAFLKAREKTPRPAGVSEADWKKQGEAAAGRHELALRVELTKSLMQARAWAAAEAELAAVFKEDPKHPAALQLQGDMALTREDWKGARDAYQRVLADQPQNTLALNNLAWILAEKLDAPAEAVGLADRLQRGRSGAKLPPERLNPEVLDTVGVVYSRAKDPDLWVRMRELFDAASRRYPADPRMALYLGHAYSRLADARKAMQAYDTAVTLSSSETCALGEAARKTVNSEATAAKTRLVPKK